MRSRVDPRLLGGGGGIVAVAERFLAGGAIDMLSASKICSVLQLIKLRI